MPTKARSHAGALGSLHRAETPMGNVARPRRSLAHVVTGALLVVVCALVFMWVQLRADASVAVLVLARTVAAGQVIAAADLRVATVTPDPTVHLVPSSQASTVVGRRAAVPLTAGVLLGPDQI